MGNLSAILHLQLMKTNVCVSYNYKYSKRKMSWPWGLPFPLNLFSFHSYSGKIEHVTAAGVHWDGQSKGRHIGGILEITGHCLLAKLIFNELWPKSLEKEVNDHIHCIYKDKGSGRLGYYTQYILNPHLHWPLSAITRTPFYRWTFSVKFSLVYTSDGSSFKNSGGHSVFTLA